MINIAEYYIQKRFPESPKHYKDVWRKRFARGDEWIYSDLAGRRLLQQIAPDIYPTDIYAHCLEMRNEEIHQ